MISKMSASRGTVVHVIPRVLLPPVSAKATEREPGERSPNAAPQSWLAFQYARCEGGRRHSFRHETVGMELEESFAGFRGGVPHG